MHETPPSKPEAEQIMMSVTPSEALRQAEIHAMRQMADAVTAQTKFFGDALGANTRSLERAVEKLDEVNERLIRVEEQKHGKMIEELRAEMRDELRGAFRRIKDLESTRDKQSGAKAMIDWLRVTTPWLFAIGAGALAYFGWQKPS